MMGLLICTSAFYFYFLPAAYVGAYGRYCPAAPRVRFHINVSSHPSTCSQHQFYRQSVYVNSRFSGISDGCRQKDMGSCKSYRAVCCTLSLHKIQEFSLKHCHVFLVGDVSEGTYVVQQGNCFSRRNPIIRFSKQSTPLFPTH